MSSSSSLKFLLLSWCCAGCNASPLRPGSPNILKPTTATATQPTTQSEAQSVRIVFAKDLGNGRRVEMVRSEFLAKPVGNPTPTPGFEELYEPFIYLGFVLTLRSTDGVAQELYNNGVPLGMLAWPSEPEYIDVAVNPAGNLAVIVWNNLGFTWADVVVRDAGGKWKVLPRPAFGDPQGKNSLGIEARSAEIFIGDKGDVNLSLARADGSRDSFHLRRLKEVSWERTNGKQ